MRNYSPYSLLEGAIPIDTLVQRTCQLGLPYLGLADHKHLFGAMEFSTACHKKGLFPILGCHMSVLMPSQKEPNDLVFWVQNERGYKNLCGLVTASTVDQAAPLREIVTWDQVTQYHEGLLVMTGGHTGPLDVLIGKDQAQQAFQILDLLSNTFKDKLYIELQRCAAPFRQDIEDQLLQWAYDKGLPLIATNPALFLTKDHFASHDILRCIAMGRYVAEEDRPMLTPNYAFKTPKEMEILFQDIPEALANTSQLAQRVGFILRTAPPKIPSFPCKDEQKLFLEESQKGLEIRLENHVRPFCKDSEEFLQKSQMYAQRLKYEQDVIIRMGFAGYFLIVSDFIRWAKRQNIPVGPGRGSGASSLVAWTLAITEVDPVRFSLLFERFLNPERVSLPDFDVDFCQEKRDQVIEYVSEKYGKGHVAHIITFGTLQARAVLRDVGRVLQMPYSQVDRICKLIPQNPANPVHLKEALEMEPQLKAMMKEEEQVHRLIYIGQQLEGLYRHASTHAAGVIISDKPLQETLPLYQDHEAMLPATEFSMKYVESAGLIKFDFLGLKTLTVIQNTLALIADRGITINIDCIPLDDRKTFELLQRVETVGIFQLESAGMSDVLRQLQPEQFEEIVALVALYRPGPMDDIPRYIACRHKREEIHYAYPCLKDILDTTFGVPVYQEQVLQIAQVLAGYSLGEADLLRRAMGKKIKAEMDTHREKFTKGAITRHGGSLETAQVLFDQIAKFAGYAFPKAHSVPYALISYQTAYLKANYPVEYMTALMNCDLNNTDKLRSMVLEARRMGLTVLSPDVNMSQALFSVENKDGRQNIRYGLAALKNVGKGAMENLWAEKDARGPFKSIEDFTMRLSSVMNKKLLEALIAAGALDTLRPERSALMGSVDRLLKTKPPSADMLFDMDAQEIPLRECPSWSLFETLEHERQAIGFYLTAHPLEEFAFDHLASVPVFCQNRELLLSYIRQAKNFSMVGMVMDVKEKASKSGQKYAFLSLSDPSGSYEVTLFSSILTQIRPLLTVGQALELNIQGRLEDDVIRFIVQTARPLKFPESIWACHLNHQDHIHQLRTLLQKVGLGETKVRISLKIDAWFLNGFLKERYHITKQDQEKWETLINRPSVSG